MYVSTLNFQAKVTFGKNNFLLARFKKELAKYTENGLKETSHYL